MTRMLIVSADAHLVCKRAKNHYDPRSDSDTASSAAGGGGRGFQDLKDRYRQLHDNQAGNMYFMVRMVAHDFKENS
jgi:eukaryotic translation initiation factor 2C